MELKVEYLSIMAQAQKLIGLGGIERFAAFAGQIAQASPQSLDKIDTDQMIDVYGNMTSIPPGIVRSDEDVEAIRSQRAQAAQAKAMAEAAPAMAGAAKDLSQANLDGNNALNALIGQAQAGQIAPGA